MESSLIRLLELHYIRENIKVKRGFTLIELVLTLAILSILSLIGIQLLSRNVWKYKNTITLVREESYAREALRFIEGEFYDVNNKLIKVEVDKLIIEKNNGDRNTIKSIKKSNGSFKVVNSYYKLKGNTTTTDTVVEDIKNFLVKNNENLVYVSIYTMHGEKFERCFGTRNIKKDL